MRIERTHTRWTLLALLALAVLSWAVSYLPVGAAGMPLAMVIAALKAGLVALSFMELAERGPTVRIVAATAPLFIVVLLALVLADVVAR